MKEIFLTFSFCFLACSACFSQTKAFEVAQEEIKNFDSSPVFSLSYDEAKYLTVAEIRFDLVKEKDPLSKQFSKFEFQLTSFFAIKGIDQNPVRNTLCLNTQGKTYQFSRENILNISFANSEMDLGEANRASEIKRGKAYEKLCWEVGKEIVQDFAVATKIEISIGNFKKEIPEDKLKIFKEYGRLLAIEKSPNR